MEIFSTKHESNVKLKNILFKNKCRGSNIKERMQPLLRHSSTQSIKCCEDYNCYEAKCNFIPNSYNGAFIFPLLLYLAFLFSKYHIYLISSTLFTFLRAYTFYIHIIQ